MVTKNSKLKSNNSLKLFDDNAIQKAMRYPTMRYMGSKHRLLSWIHEVLAELEFETVLDGFSGSGSVSYLLKAMGKTVYANDFLHFAHLFAKATVENQEERLNEEELQWLLEDRGGQPSFIQDTFTGIFFTEPDLKFLDRVSHNIQHLSHPLKKSMALAALMRACLKRQPRGVFTIAGDLSHYDDGRRDLQLSLEEHFREQVEVFNQLVFNNFRQNQVFNQDVFSIDVSKFKPDLVYLDPPYVPRSDDNCYVKRYHFLEGLSKYWEGEMILEDTKVKKIQKKYTPFSYRKTAVEAFEQLFRHFRQSIIVLSYSSNGFPDLELLVELLQRHKNTVTVHQQEHRYHFGTHSSVERAVVSEYLIIGI